MLPRLIPVVIVNKGIVVQSVRFKHTNPIHSDAVHAIDAFGSWAADEIVLLDVSREPDPNFPEILDHVTANCFVPVTAGGWITDMAYADRLLRSGADKLIVNTALHDDPSLVTEMANEFGSQCVVASLDVKNGEVWVDRGRRNTHSDAVGAALTAVERGAGEILLNSITHDGNRGGYDLFLLASVCEVDVPVIAFGGVSRWEHLVEGIRAGASAVAAANIFHYTEESVRKAKRYLAEAGVSVRREYAVA